MRLRFWILFTILSLLMAAVLELNRNTLPGWILLAAALAGYIFLYHKNLIRHPWPVRGLAWACLCAVFILILFLTWPPVRAVPAVSVRNPEQTEVIQTAYGPVAGVYNEDHTVEVFAGIPYAMPPVGELRWKKPQNPESWTDVRLCGTFAPMSMQSVNLPIYDSLARIIGYHDYKISLTDNWRPPVSEDSLYLNIWKPAGEQENLPVLVYIHGGSLQTGQPWYGDYNGEHFAEDGVITVNMGYRLGVFGFLADEELLSEEGTTGNYGLLDQIQALKWIRDNIAAFGGDPDNVTIVGESAGSVCVDALCVSPLAAGLFKRAILESSTLSSVTPPHSYRSLEEALLSGSELKEKYQCSSADELRTLPAEKIVAEMNTQHHLTPDGYALPADPYIMRSQGVHNEEALLHGYNSEESGPFIIFDHAKLRDYEERVRGYFGEYADDVLAIYPAETDEEADRNWAAIYGAIFFNYPHYCLNRLAVENGIPVWEYYFSKQNGRLGSWHSGEMIYAFGNIPEDSSLFDEGDRELSRVMHAAWVHFAENGDPNGTDVPEFPQNSTSEKLMQFGEEVGEMDEPFLRLYEILDQMQNA